MGQGVWGMEQGAGSREQGKFRHLQLVHQNLRDLCVFLRGLCGKKLEFYHKGLKV